MILLSGLLLGQTIAMPVSASSNELFSLKTQRRHHKAHIKKYQQHKQSKSVSLLISGYVEDNVLVLSFSISLKSVQLQVVDSETGITVFEGTASGNSLSIPLKQDSENFEVYIN